MSGTITPGKKQGWKAQIGIAPTVGGTAVLCATLKDLDWEIKADALDSTDHSGSGWKGTIPGLLSWSGTAKFDYFEGDAQITALRAAILAGSYVNISIYHEQAATGSGEPVYNGQAMLSSAKFGGKTNDLQGMDVQLEGNLALVLGSQ